MPNLSDLVKGKVSILDIHELDIDDLLGRECVPDQSLLSKSITQKTIMVTGQEVQSEGNFVAKFLN